MALRGIRVLELAGLAPAPMCGMILQDFGASVTLVNKVNAVPGLDVLANGKKSVALNLKKPEGVEVFRKLVKKTDVIIEPFRAGVMEALGLGPEQLLAANPRLVYARLTGFGQNGPFSKMAGHDINYVALSGALSYLGRAGEKPTFPVNLIADFGGGGLMCALGILMALFERTSSGQGQIVDAAMVEGSAYLSSWIFRSSKLPIWGNERGHNILDTGAHFYDTYETKDGKYMAVGALESQFYSELVEKLGLKHDSPVQYGNFEQNKQLFTDIFKTKTQEEWSGLFDGSDACVTPVLSPEQAVSHPHNAARQVFAPSKDEVIPNPAPKLSRTPAKSFGSVSVRSNGADTVDMLLDAGYSAAQIKQLHDSNIVFASTLQSTL